MIMALHVVIKEKPVDLRRQLMEGRASVPLVGSVTKVERIHPPFVVLDSAGVEIVDVTEYLRDLALGDASPLSGRSYAFGLLRWFRMLWLLGVTWEKATEAEVAVLVGWLRTAPNPQRRRSAPGTSGPGGINPRTGKPTLAAGLCPHDDQPRLVLGERVLRIPRPSRSRTGGQSGAVLAATPSRAGPLEPVGTQAGNGQGTAASPSYEPSATTPNASSDDPPSASASQL
ncbi:hypothetical protein M8542_02645 [Amycolatopsis sp. OK19-0408]|uniref:Uncharacterized protein n=1 Tax=Amycolatopsis iheyensis TaxID=2945988 RepID=A0A9X2SID8_9PSEU|nr:hypothetical protein [Amycolatopsis iheyensis]MCR6481706.1 hypothetical protein [Amycolatopsis iheyensis]